MYKNYIMENLSLLDAKSVLYSIQCINGAVQITNHTFITNQPHFVNAYLSTASIRNSTIFSINSDSIILAAVESNLTISDIKVRDLYTSEFGTFMQASFGSYVSLTNIEYTNSTMKFIETLSSQLQINTLSVFNISLTQHVIDFVDCQNIELNDLVMHNINTTKDYMMYMARSSINQIMNMTVYDVDVTVLEILESNITLMDDIQIHDAVQGIYARHSSISIIQNSHIYRCGNSNLPFGGAINIKNSDMDMMNITLEYNTAQTGGAIHIDCDSYEICRNVITNSTLSNNIALKQGGAINYNFRRPKLSNMIYRNNMAVYGPDIASYPVRIVNSDMVDESMILRNVASGIAYHETIKMSLIDYDNQIMNLVSNSQIKIVPVTTDAKLQGVDYSVLINGESKFDNLQFVYGPGQENIEYIATCELIDFEKVSYLNLPTNNSIEVSFRN